MPPRGHRGRRTPPPARSCRMFVSDYVLMSYGTGIVMGVPGHDQRDWDFATKFGLPIVEVVKGGDITKGAFTLKDDTGIMVNSGFLNGMTVKEAIPAMKQCAIGPGHRATKRSTTSCATGSSPASATGASPSPWSAAPKCGWRAGARGSAARRSAAGRELRADRRRRKPPVQDDRLGQHHLPVLRRPRQA